MIERELVMDNSLRLKVIFSAKKETRLYFTKYGRSRVCNNRKKLQLDHVDETNVEGYWDRVLRTYYHTL